MKVFLDTNVLISAFASRGLCLDVLGAVLDGHELRVGEVVLSELRTVLARKLKVPSDVIGDIETFLREFHVEPIPKNIPDFQLSERSDAIVVASAIATGADTLVTGDKEIQNLRIERIRIVSPREFWILASGRKTKGRRP